MRGIEIKPIVLTLLVLLLPSLAFALKSYPFPTPGNTLIGQVQQVYPEKGERISDIARLYNVGFYELIEANPAINRHSPLPVDEKITIPSAFLLPNTKTHEGIVINLPELRLYYYNRNKGVVQTGPIAIGRFNWKTPEMSTKVIRKEKDPVWVVPKSIKAENARKGIHLPDVMPAGPKNPLGKYMLRLGNWVYLIHGTNAPNSIGKRASSGCMRMFPESIEILFQEVALETPVEIVNQPIKVGWHQGALYMEVHEPLHEAAMSRTETFAYAQQLIDHAVMDKHTPINWSLVRDVIKRASGIPTQISGHGAPPYEDPVGSRPLLHGKIEFVSESQY